MTQETAADNLVTVVGWKDNKALYFTSNCEGRSPEATVKRYSNVVKKRIAVKQPQCIHKYNTSMGGVDRADQNVSSYRIGIRSKKWWWALFAWVPDVIMQNCWLLYRKYKSPSDPNHDLLSFRMEVAEIYFVLYARSSCATKRGGSCLEKRRKIVPSDIRLDKKNHFSEKTPNGITKRCGYCGGNTRKWCSKCKKGIHDRCFNMYHDFVPGQ